MYEIEDLTTIEFLLSPDETHDLDDGRALVQQICPGPLMSREQFAVLAIEWAVKSLREGTVLGYPDLRI